MHIIIYITRSDTRNIQGVCECSIRIFEIIMVTALLEYFDPLLCAKHPNYFLIKCGVSAPTVPNA